MRAALAALLFAACAACAEPARPVAVPRQPPPAVKPEKPREAPLPGLVRDPFLTPAEESPLAPAEKSRPAPRAAPLHLEALVVPPDGRGKVAIINGRPYAEGERVGEEVLQTIAVDRIVLISAAGARRTVRFDDAGPPQR